MHFPASLGRKQHLVAGVLGIGLGFGLPFLLSVAMVAASGELSLLILPLPFLGALWTIQGLAPSGYTLEDRGVRIERRWLRRFRPDAAARPRREVAERVYRDLVKQARTPSFYRDLGVPDTPEGRFEMVGLHAALVMRRLRAAGAPGSALAQELFDLLFADVDA